MPRAARAAARKHSRAARRLSQEGEKIAWICATEEGAPESRAPHREGCRPSGKSPCMACALLQARGDDTNYRKPGGSYGRIGVIEAGPPQGEATADPGQGNGRQKKAAAALQGDQGRARDPRAHRGDDFLSGGGRARRVRGNDPGVGRGAQAGKDPAARDVPARFDQ